MKLPRKAKASLILILVALLIEALFLIYAVAKPHVSEDYELLLLGLASFGVAIILHIASGVLGVLSLKQTKAPCIWLPISALHFILFAMALMK